MSTATLIIPAAGSGSRLNRETPKPYIRLSGRTILEHTISRFTKLDILRNIVVATAPGFVSQAESLLESMLSDRYSFTVISGGQERQHSIFNALKHVADTELVIVHDAVRPFVKLEHVRHCCDAALETGASVLGVPTKDTIKQVDDEYRIQKTPARKYLWQAQTPQVFRREIIKRAYEKAFEDNFIGTDDASLVERMGEPVVMVQGDRSNFKITYPLDLELARLLLERKDGGSEH